MHKINIMLSSRPKLLSDVMRNLIERQPGMTIVGDVVDPIQLLFALRETSADVVIISPHKANGAPRICGQLLKENPLLKILILTPENEAVYVYQSGFDRVCIGKPSARTILDIIFNNKEQ